MSVHDLKRYNRNMHVCVCVCVCVCVDMAVGFSRFLTVRASLGISVCLTAYWNQLSLLKATHRVKFSDQRK